MKIKGPYAIQGKSEQFFGFDIRTANQEELSVFDYIGKINIGGISLVTVINDGAVCWGAINHLAESAIFVSSAGRPDDKIQEFFVQDGIDGVYVDLAESFCGFTIRTKESIGVMEGSENISSGAVAGNEGIFTFEQVNTAFLTEGKEFDTVSLHGKKNQGQIPDIQLAVMGEIPIGIPCKPAGIGSQFPD